VPHIVCVSVHAYRRGTGVASNLGQPLFFEFTEEQEVCCGVGADVCVCVCLCLGGLASRSLAKQRRHSVHSGPRLVLVAKPAAVAWQVSTSIELLRVELKAATAAADV